MDAPSTTANIVWLVSPRDPTLSAGCSGADWRQYVKTLDESHLGLTPGHPRPARFGVRALTFAERGQAKSLHDGWDWSLFVLSCGLVSMDGGGGDMPRDLERSGPRGRLEMEVIEQALGGDEDLVYQLAFAIGHLSWPGVLEKKSEWQSGSPTRPTRPSTAGSAVTTHD